MILHCGRLNNLDVYGEAKNAFWIFGDRPAVAKFINNADVANFYHKLLTEGMVDSEDYKSEANEVGLHTINDGSEAVVNESETVGDNVDGDDDFDPDDFDPDDFDSCNNSDDSEEVNKKWNAFEKTAQMEISTMKKTIHRNNIQIFGAVKNKEKGQVLMSQRCNRLESE